MNWRGREYHFLRWLDWEVSERTHGIIICDDAARSWNTFVFSVVSYQDIMKYVCNFFKFFVLFLFEVEYFDLQFVWVVVELRWSIQWRSLRLSFRRSYFLLFKYVVFVVGICSYSFGGLERTFLNFADELWNMFRNFTNWGKFVGTELIVFEFAHGGFPWVVCIWDMTIWLRMNDFEYRLGL